MGSLSLNVSPVNGGSAAAAAAAAAAVAAMRSVSTAAAAMSVVPNGKVVHSMGTANGVGGVMMGGNGLGGAALIMPGKKVDREHIFFFNNPIV